MTSSCKDDMRRHGVHMMPLSRVAHSKWAFSHLVFFERCNTACLKSVWTQHFIISLRDRNDHWLRLIHAGIKVSNVSKTCDPSSIASHINKFFSDIGPELSKYLHDNSDKTVSFCMKPTILSSFNFEWALSEIVEKQTKTPNKKQKPMLELSSKHRCRPDGLSTNLLKMIM